MLQRPGESYAVWHFWQEPDRRFDGWYLNLQEAFRQTEIGYDKQGLELDVWVPVECDRSVKDVELMGKRIADGRFTRAEVDEIFAEGDRIGRLLDAGERCWYESWSRSEPPADLVVPSLPEGWNVV